jgi:NarL family two-component system response regulator LiaR
MERSQPIRVMIVDDHNVLSSSLAISLNSCAGIRVIGQANNGEEAVALCAELQPDVILMDLVMPVMDGLTATRIIRERFPQTQIVILTSYDEEDRIHEALNAGALSYLLKTVSIGELDAAIRAAHAGQATLSQEALQALVGAAQRPSEPSIYLTGREKEVLELMVQGMTNIEIAERLSISRFTAKKHVSNILAKLNSSSRTEAIIFAIQHKVVGV